MSDKYTKILLIEDNPSYTRLVQKMLAVSSQVEYQIECVERLSTGLEYLVKGEIDVVLLDLGLPDSQGLDTLRKVHAQAPAVPIVVLTGIDDETLAVQAMRQGAQDYLVKGDINSKTLQRVIRYAIERKWVEEAVRESKEFLDSLISSMQDGFSILDANGVHIDVNPALCNMTGFSRGELVGVGPPHPYWAPEAYEEIESAFQKTLRGEFGSFEFTFMRRNGERFPVVVSPSWIKDSQGNVVSYFATVKDITERKRMQFQLLQAERISALGTMAAGVAHELLNPMMGMLNFAQYCLKHTAKGDPRYPVLQDIERETRRCADIVRNLTTFSRMGKQEEEEYQKESFATIIDRVVKLLSYRIEKEHVSLTRHVAKGTPKIWMQVNSMQQVLLNLISNALDVLMKSQKKEIHIEVHREGDFVQLTVADSGCGLAPENLEKIYDPFFTTKPTGQGMGLGLTTSRSIIDSRGGDITCESKLGVGTTFKILLPAETKGGEK